MKEAPDWTSLILMIAVRENCRNDLHGNCSHHIPGCLGETSPNCFIPVVHLLEENGTGGKFNDIGSCVAKAVLHDQEC